MSGLLLIITECHPLRLDAGVELAATLAAMDRPVAVLLRGTALAACKQAPLADALMMLRDLGAELLACQTAMNDAGLHAADLPPSVRASGMVAALKGRADWQLLLI